MKLTKLVKMLMAIIIATAVCIPTLLTLDGGPDATNGIERVRLTNLIGFCYMAFLAFGGFKLITPQWVRDELSELFPEYLDEEDDEEIAEENQ